MSSEKITLRNVDFNVIFSHQEDLKLDGQVVGSMFFKDELVLKFEGIGRKGMFDSITIINADLESNMLDHLKDKGFNERLLAVETFLVEAFFIFESQGIIKSYAKGILDEHLEKQKELYYLKSPDKLSDSFGVFIFETDANLVSIIQNTKEYDENNLDKLYAEKGLSIDFKSVYYLYYNVFNIPVLVDLTK